MRKHKTKTNIWQCVIKLINTIICKYSNRSEIFKHEKFETNF